MLKVLETVFSFAYITHFYLYKYMLLTTNEIHSGVICLSFDCAWVTHAKQNLSFSAELPCCAYSH